MKQEGVKKRGKNVYSGSSEYHADPGDSVSRPVFAAVLCFTSSLAGYGNVRFVYISIFFEMNDR